MGLKQLLMPLGYELSGNQALFKGDLKLVKNAPPIGDGQWHLYNLRDDPGETRDLPQPLPEAFKAMQVDYAAWAREHGVLPIPEGYSPQRQVMINSWHNDWWLQFGAVFVALPLVLLAGFWMLIRTWRRRRP